MLKITHITHVSTLVDYIHEFKECSNKISTMEDQCIRKITGVKYTLENKRCFIQVN